MHGLSLRSKIHDPASVSFTDRGSGRSLLRWPPQQQDGGALAPAWVLLDNHLLDALVLHALPSQNLSHSRLVRGLLGSLKVVQDRGSLGPGHKVRVVAEHEVTGVTSPRFVFDA